MAISSRCCRAVTSQLKPLMLLAHIDVVEANRADWERDPFKLVEEDGFFYARGVVRRQGHGGGVRRLMVRFKKEGYRPKRTIKLALTCGEETPNIFNGVSYLIENHRDLIDAGFALNEGGGGRYDQKTGVYRYVAVLASEKVYQDFTLSTPEPGRALVAAHARQRDLSTGARARQSRSASIQGRIQRHLARLFREIRRHRRRAERRRHDRGREEWRRSGHRTAQEGSDVQCHPAHQLRGHAARGRPRAQCPAAARDGQRQLPHVSRVAAPKRSGRNSSRPSPIRV